VNHQDCRYVRADCIEGTVPERDLAVVADEDVQAEQRDREDEDVRQPEKLQVRRE